VVPSHATHDGLSSFDLLSRVGVGMLVSFPPSVWAFLPVCMLLTPTHVFPSPRASPPPPPTHTHPAGLLPAKLAPAAPRPPHGSVLPRIAPPRRVATGALPVDRRRQAASASALPDSRPVDRRRRVVAGLVLPPPPPPAPPLAPAPAPVDRRRPGASARRRRPTPSESVPPSWLPASCRHNSVACAAAVVPALAPPVGTTLVLCRVAVVPCSGGVAAPPRHGVQT